MSIPLLPEVIMSEVEAATAKLQGRIKAITLIACTGATALLVLSDWDNYTGGREHAFSHIRPRVRSYLNSLYGVTEEEGSNKR